MPESPARRLAGLKRVVDVAIAQAVDVVLIVGDLFDSSRVPDSQITEAWGEIARLRVPVILTPGNHDCLGEPSIYSRARPPEELSDVHFLDDPAGRHAILPELRLTVWARGLVDHNPSHFPLLGYERRVENNWQVALAHGHYVPAGQIINGSSPLQEEQIAQLECDYLALGHWHRFADVSANGTPAFYSGSPSESYTTFVSVNLVTLDRETGTRVDRVALETTI